MSAYTTLYVTRAAAIEALVTRTLSDADLEKLLNQILEPRLYRAQIVEDSDVNDNELL